MAKNNAKMIDINTIIQAGFDPATGLPSRLGIGTPAALKNDIRRLFRIVDEQDAVNRYTWYNLPMNVSSQELERMLYYKGQLAFFYDKHLEEFFFMPYALDGTIDFYGRFNSIHPVPMTSGTTEEEKKAVKAQEQYLSTLKLKCHYGVVLDEDNDIETFENSAVLLHDYTKQLSQTITARQILNEPLIDVMSNIVPYLNTALLSGTGIKGMRVNDADQARSVKDASTSVNNAALSSEPWIPIVGNIEFQELTDGSLLGAQEYLLSLQSLDNLRLQTLGLENGGLFEKQAHVLESEQAVNQSNVSLIMQDGLSIRQNFCNIVNSIWGIGIWCEPTENIIQGDLNGDGVTYQENADTSNSGVSAGGADNGNDANV